MLADVLHTLLDSDAKATPKADSLSELEKADAEQQLIPDTRPLSLRVEEFRRTHAALKPWLDQHAWPQARCLDLLWRLWLPLAKRVQNHQQTHQGPWIQGILGGQGTGKSTLAEALVHILAEFGIRAHTLSIDDLYSRFAEREILRQSQPALRWRGPPGTHDLALGCHTLDVFRQGPATAPLALPRFDKSLHQGEGDRIAPREVTCGEVLFFEGWCVGLEPIDDARFEQPQQLPALLQDPARLSFARAMNQALKNYLPLWQRLHGLWILAAEDYRYSKMWRLEAEHRMKAQGKSGMSDADINDFVDYFWSALHPELHLQAALEDPQRAELILHLDRDHSPCRVQLQCA